MYFEKRGDRGQVPNRNASQCENIKYPYPYPYPYLYSHLALSIPIPVYCKSLNFFVAYAAPIVLMDPINKQTEMAFTPSVL